MIRCTGIARVSHARCQRRTRDIASRRRILSWRLDAGATDASSVFSDPRVGAAPIALRHPRCTHAARMTVTRPPPPNRKLVVRDGRLTGATLLGDVADARRLRTLIATGQRVADELLE